MLSQRPLNGTAEPCAGVAHWRYRGLSRRPSVFCSVHRSAGVAQPVAHDVDVLSGTNNFSANVTFNADIQADHTVEIDDSKCLANNGSTKAPGQLRQIDSSLIIYEQDILGQCYSTVTVSAMARLMGHQNGTEVFPSPGQAAAVAMSKAQLLTIVKAGSGTPLDDASAALALLCEAGQYELVVQYGGPLLKAAFAALPFSPVAVGKQPVPHLERLAADLALSIALAHISLAGGVAAAGAADGGVGVGSSSIPALLAVGTAGSGRGLMTGFEEVHAHLESALQVLERHSVAPQLQQEVASCLQGVAIAFAEETLRSTPPVLQPSAPGTPLAPGQASSSQASINATSTSTAAAATSAAVSRNPTGSSASPNATASPGSSSATAAACRAKAISMLRSVLWRCTSHRHQNDPRVQQQPRQQMDKQVAPEGSLPSASSSVSNSTTSSLSSIDIGGSVAASSMTGGNSGVWVPELTSDERAELMAPLRGLLAASEHIALYGPIASGQKPYGGVQLSDQELYDLGIAHLAQGVSTGWPQHVLQALSYFERVAQQQQQQQGSSAGELRDQAAAADVSFERSVCEVLLGRRIRAAGKAEPLPASAASLPGSAGLSTGDVPSTAAVLPYSMFGEEWGDVDEAALLRRLEAQLLPAVGNGGAAGASGLLSVESSADGDVSFKVNERDGDGAEGQHSPGPEEGRAAEPDGSAGGSVATAAAATGDALAARPPAASAWRAAAAQPHSNPKSSSDKLSESSSAPSPPSPPPPPQQQQLQPKPQQQQTDSSGKTRSKVYRDDDVARKYGWAESWLELSVMPCFPETAGAGSVSLTRWFSDPRVILFNKLLTVRSGAEVTAALGSAVAHVSDASRQRLWKLWQAAAHAVSSARGAQSAQQHQQPQAAAADVAEEMRRTTTSTTSTTSSLKVDSPASAPVSGSAPPAETVTTGTASPQSRTGAGSSGTGFLAQSRAALQDVAPRAAAAASAVAAAAAAAVGSAAVSSPRAVAAAAGWMVPFALAKGWRPAEKSAPSAPGGTRPPAAAQALPRAVMGTDTAVRTDVADPPRGEVPAASGGRWFDEAEDARGDHANNVLSQQVHPRQERTEAAIRTNNVVPFPGGATAIAGRGGGSSPVLLPPTTAPGPVPSAVAEGLVGEAPAKPSAGGGAPPADVAGSETSGPSGGALWASDAEGHLHPRPRMVTRVVQRAAASIKERVATLPGAPRDWSRGAGWDPAVVDEAMSREAVQRVAAVAAQAISLGALAAYVGNRIVTSGALQAAAASGYQAAAAVAAPTVDASTAQVAAAARAVARWLDSAGMGGAAEEALGQWPLLVHRDAVRPAELLPFANEVASAESVGRLAEQYGRGAQLDETAAAGLLRGWAAARAAAPALADPRDRSDLLAGLLGGRALKIARVEAERNARMGRRVQVQRIDVEIEQLRCRAATSAPGAGSSGQAHGQGCCVEATVTAVVVTAGTETSRASPLPLSYCSRERLTLTFRKAVPEMANVTAVAAAAHPAGAAAAQGAVWRLVDVRDAPPGLY